MRNKQTAIVLCPEGEVLLYSDRRESSRFEEQDQNAWDKRRKRRQTLYKARQFSCEE